MSLLITKAQAREHMTGQLKLRRMMPQTGAQGACALLNALRCIQLDPLDKIGTNADLVAIARVEGLGRSDIYKAVLGEHGFEHFAKERCLLPASAFPYYKGELVRAPWYDDEARKAGVTQATLDAVLEQLREHGPMAISQLDDHGMTQAPGWHGVKATSAAKLATEVLWAQCKLVVAGRTGPGLKRKLYDVPERALAAWHDAPTTTSYEAWALKERVEAAGLLGHHAGPHWSSLAKTRKSALPKQLAQDDALVEVSVEGSPRRYWAPADFLEREHPEQDELMRVLGPLDPLLWDRGLVSHIFDFDYVWEVYKPAAKRTWGYYVCPLLYQGQLVGRIEAHRGEDDALVIDNLWHEADKPWDQAAFDDAMGRLEAAQRPHLIHSYT